MSEFLKPQSPLQHKDGAFIYPLTTADQVILEDNNRLNFALKHLVYVDEEHQESAVASLDADTLGGHPVEDFLRPKAGFIYPLAGSVIPEGFLLCDGAEYGRTEFPELFAAIGTIYGNGNGSTTFNVPNLQTRVPVGAGNGYGLGATGGEATHTLTVDEMPKHKHWYNNYQQGYPTNFTDAEQYRTPVTKMADSREKTTNYPNTDSNYTGGSQPHNNMQPYTVVNYIIATGKDTGVSVSDIVMGAQAIPLGVEYGGTGATNAADALKNLGGLSMELLWENASPASAFGKQAITLDLSGFSKLDIVCRIGTSTAVYATFSVYLNTDRMYILVSSDNNGKTIERSCRQVDDGLYIEMGYLYNSYGAGSADNNYLIPCTIYGIKGVSA